MFKSKKRLYSLLNFNLTNKYLHEITTNKYLHKIGTNNKKNEFETCSWAPNVAGQRGRAADLLGRSKY